MYRPPNFQSHFKSLQVYIMIPSKITASFLLSSQNILVCVMQRLSSNLREVSQLSPPSLYCLLRKHPSLHAFRFHSYSAVMLHHCCCDNLGNYSHTLVLPVRLTPDHGFPRSLGVSKTNVMYVFCSCCYATSRVSVFMYLPPHIGYTHGNWLLDTKHVLEHLSHGLVPH